MIRRNITGCVKNAVGTVFLLAGTFFVCSTLISMRAVFADPIAPTMMPGADMGTQVANTTSRRATANVISREGVTTRGTTTRAVTARTATPRGSVINTTQNGTNVSRATATNNRGVATRTTNANARRVAPTATNNRGVATRNVVSRTNNNTRTGAASTRARTVVPRTAAANSTNTRARVSLQGNAIRGSKSTTSSGTTYTYLANKLYTGNYSNIIDSSTGLISADAYSTCMESYYTCMDEICTARNAAQGRCACAYRTRAFAAAEDALETANEELIKVSGELALLIATKGKDVSAAFKLTDAEKIMNCASYAEILASGDDAEITEWCNEHKEYTGTGTNITVSTCTKTAAPTYCSDMSTNYGFDLADLGGSGSDILASLRSWAAAKDSAKEMLVDDNTNLLSQYTNVQNIVSGMNITTGTDSEQATLDELANTWGYELFEYAHNNVCSRVLDSCFNGIYEACGNPPSGGRCANSAASACPFNYNSKITVSSSGDVTLNERGSSSATNNTTATCFGYTSSSGDPYVSLRGPVADARRSVMQKYLLDANAACDAYGEQLRTTAQNIGYQKAAAQQALQQKRMEFVQQEQEQMSSDALTAQDNLDKCIAEIFECYELQIEEHGKDSGNTVWTAQRINTYCSQMANIPHCYETMICHQNDLPFDAIIDDPDNTACLYSEDPSKNTCRNVVNLNELLNGFNKEAAVCELEETCDSEKARAMCVKNMMLGFSSGEDRPTTMYEILQNMYNDNAE